MTRYNSLWAYRRDTIMPPLVVQREWLELIRNGTKTVEGRPGPVKHTKGQALVLVPDKDTSMDMGTLAIVVDVRVYPTLEAYLEVEFAKAAPHCSTIEEAKEAYLNIYSVEKGQVFESSRLEKLGGIVALELTLV